MMDTDSDSERSDTQDVFTYYEYLENFDIDFSEEDPAEQIPPPVDSNYDMTLPTTHSYLGNNFNELNGRTLLDEGIYRNLTLLVRQSLVLFPGQTLAVTVFDSRMIELMKSCVETNRTFGVVCSLLGQLATIGTTAEIFEFMDGGRAQGFRIKAKGRQRFKIENIQGSGNTCANVRIVSEITLGSPFFGERLACLDGLRMPTNKQEPRRQQEIDRLDAIVTSWPYWVCRQHDPKWLSANIQQRLHFLHKRGSNIPEDPTELSLWVAQNLPLGDKERISLLDHDSAPRLQTEWKYLDEDRWLTCSFCGRFMAMQSDMYPMSKEGPLNIYYDLSTGGIHETVTFHRAQGFITPNNDPPSTQYSWFPGYAWTPAVCKGCFRHRGWRFNAIESHMKPEVFWCFKRICIQSEKIPKDIIHFIESDIWIVEPTI